MNSQYNDQNKECRHHNLGNSLKAILQAKTADNKSGNNCNCHEYRHFNRICQQIGEYTAYSIRIHSAFETAGYEFDKVAQHPAGYGCIIHHQQHTADHTEPAVNVPFLAILLQCFISLNCTLLACTSHCQLHCQDRHAHAKQEYQIKQDKDTAAVLSCHIWKTPHIANTDSTACAYQNKSQSGLKIFSIHTSISPK